MALVDRRWRLVGAVDLRTTVAVVSSGVVGFLLWDLLGISSGVFFRGQGPWLTGWSLAPQVPVEEAIFLVLLVHVTLVADATAGRLLASGPAARTLLHRATIMAGAALLTVVVVSTVLAGGLRGTFRSLTYTLVAAVVLAPVLLLATRLGRVAGRCLWDLRALVTLAGLSTLTMVFDSALVGTGVVSYDWSRTLGPRLGLAPLEDLSYTVAACALAPAVWAYWHTRKEAAT